MFIKALGLYLGSLYCVTIVFIMAASVPLCDRIFRARNTNHHSISHISSPAARPGSYKGWSTSALHKACDSVHDGMSIRRAAEEYNIPKSTLFDYISGRVEFGAKSGAKPYLTEAEEEELVSFLNGMSSIGYSRTVKEVVQLVQAVVTEKGLNVTVTSSWWHSFKSRHPELVLRSPETLSHARLAGSSVSVLESYFDLLETTLTEAELTDRPCQIFNADESGFPLSPKAPKIIAKKNYKHPAALSSGNKSQITVLCCCSAGGYSIPPFVVFDRKVLKPEYFYGLNDSGWMETELFETWFLHHFLVYAPPVRPLLLLMDGHSSHFSPVFVNKAAEEQVLVFCLPPHSSHKTQPLDKGIFSPLKRAWREVCHNYTLSHPDKVVTRFQFSSLFGQAWAQAMTPQNIMSGFKVTGVYPVDRYKVLPNSPPKPPTLCERTGLKFIPLLTPLHNRTPRKPSAVTLPVTSVSQSDGSISDDSLDSPPGNASHTRLSKPDPEQFSEAEVMLYMKRKEEGYDITTDKRYNLWLSLQSKQPVLPQPISRLSKVIANLPPVTKNSTFVPRSTAQVVTSEECRKEINEKARKKLEAQREKEERKLDRERKKEERKKVVEEKKRIQEEKKKMIDEKKRLLAENKQQRKQSTNNAASTVASRGAVNNDSVTNIASRGTRAGRGAVNEDSVTNIAPTRAGRGAVNDDSVTDIDLRGTRAGRRAVNNDSVTNIASRGTRARRGAFNDDSVTDIDLRGTRAGRGAVNDDSVNKAKKRGAITVTDDTRISSQVFEMGSCQSGDCCHPRATNWVNCSECDDWLHCICAEVSCNKARNKDFVFICRLCQSY